MSKAYYTIAFYTRHIDLVKELYEEELGYMPVTMFAHSAYRFSWTYAQDKQWLDSRGWFEHAEALGLVKHVKPEEEEVDQGVDF